MKKHVLNSNWLLLSNNRQEWILFNFTDINMDFKITFANSLNLWIVELVDLINFQLVIQVIQLEEIYLPTELLHLGMLDVYSIQ